jgi:hypothetical protein
MAQVVAKLGRISALPKSGDLGFGQGTNAGLTPKIIKDYGRE